MILLAESPIQWPQLQHQTNTAASRTNNHNNQSMQSICSHKNQQLQEPASKANKQSTKECKQRRDRYCVRSWWSIAKHSMWPAKNDYPCTWSLVVWQATSTWSCNVDGATGWMGVQTLVANWTAIIVCAHPWQQQQCWWQWPHMQNSCFTSCAMKYQDLWTWRLLMHVSKFSQQRSWN